MLFGNSIHKGVMKVIKTRIAEAQRSHDSECESLDKTCETERMAANARKERGKQESAERHINSIIGKII